MSDILVTRDHYGPFCTNSTVLVVDRLMNRHILYGLEPPLSQYKHVKPYAIPDGVYDLKYTWSHRLQKNTWQVMNVKDFDGIRVHSGNHVCDTLGCLLLGEKHDLPKNEIYSSRDAVKEFESLLDPKVTYRIKYVTVENQNRNANLYDVSWKQTVDR